MNLGTADGPLKLRLLMASAPMRCVARYNAPPISRGSNFPYNSQKTPIVSPTGQCMGVFREFVVGPNFYFKVVVLCATPCFIVLCYIESPYVLWVCSTDDIF